MSRRSPKRRGQLLALWSPNVVTVADEAAYTAERGEFIRGLLWCLICCLNYTSIPKGTPKNLQIAY